MKKVYVITSGCHKKGYNPFGRIVFGTYELALSALEEYRKDDPRNFFIHETVWANGDKQACLLDMVTKEAFFTETHDMVETEADVITLPKNYI